MDSVVTITADRPTEQLGGPAFDWLIGAVDALSAGHKGRIATLALQQAGYADPGLEAAYAAAPDTIDRYFENIDIEAVTAAFEGTKAGKSTKKIGMYAGGAFAAGFVFGYLLG